MKELKINKATSILGFLATMVVIFIIFYLSFGSYQFPFQPKDYVIFVLWLISTIVFLIWFIKSFKIEYDSKGIYVTKMNKVKTITFSSILYFDEEYTIKHKVLTLYNDKGKAVFVNLDKEKELINVIKTKCKHLISKEQYKMQFPNANI